MRLTPESRVTMSTRPIAPEFKKIPGAKRRPLPAFVDPSLALLSETVPNTSRWLHEIKYDGYRMQARIEGRNVRLLTRKALDWTERFESIVVALRELELKSAWIDGEIVVEDEAGVSSFNNLQADLKAGRQDRFLYYVFDLLYLDGFDLREVVLSERKRLLEQILRRLPPNSRIRFSEHLDGNGQAMFEHACRLGLEGIISKRKDLPYRFGRGEHWLKSKCVLRQEFVILGYAPSTKIPGSAASLVLGYYDRGKLVYAGRVGTGSFVHARSLREDLDSLSAPKPAFGSPPPRGADKGVHWAKPRLVAEIEYRGWTKDWVLRHASFKGLREDKPPEEIVLETRRNTAR